MEKVSVVIPNFNGASLLEKNLPFVIKNTPSAEVIVVDDASTDNSVNILKKKFKKVKVISLRKNVGFAQAANTGVRNSRHNLVLLLNSDVVPRKNYLAPAIKYFKMDDTFSVGLEDQSHEKGKIIPRGRGGARFKKGFVEHFAIIPDRGITLWTSGGSSLISKEKFIKLGGFDSAYRPFYWEDIDLGFRAWRSGFKCYFEPLSKVDHYHEEGAILKNTSATKIKIISYKNQFLFVWKNIDDYRLISQHLLWLPFNFLKAFFGLDFAFYLGFFYALINLKNVVLVKNIKNYHLSEQQVLNNFL